jgi:transcription elongation factor Elf1
MSVLFFTCPNTNQRAPTGVQMDVQSLRASWSKQAKVNCSLCGNVHEFAFRELYTESTLRDAADIFRRA